MPFVWIKKMVAVIKQCTCKLARLDSSQSLPIDVSFESPRFYNMTKDVCLFFPIHCHTYHVKTFETDAILMNDNWP